MEKNNWKIVRENTIHKDGISRMKIVFEEVEMGSPEFGEILSKEITRGHNESMIQFAQEFIDAVVPRLSIAETEILIEHLQKTIK